MKIPQTLAGRLQYGAALINTRRWREKESAQFVLDTTVMYPNAVQAWLQAFTLLLNGKHYLWAMTCLARVHHLASGEEGEDYLAIGNMWRDLAIQLIRKGDEASRGLAETALVTAYHYHTGLPDPNLVLCLDSVQARLRLLRGEFTEAANSLARVYHAYQRLGDRVNEQWAFNHKLHYMRDANRRGKMDLVADLATEILADTERCTRRHRWFVRLMRIPGGWWLVGRR